MNQEELRLVNEAVERASTCPPEDRAAVIEEACGGDARLRVRIEHILATKINTIVLPDTPRVGAEPGISLGTASAAALVGVTIDGRYELRELLGEGGMGAVYRGQHGLERQVAVKVIRTALLADLGIRERFKREALAAARLRHPNIVTIHDFGAAIGGLAPPSALCAAIPTVFVASLLPRRSIIAARYLTTPARRSRRGTTCSVRRESRAPRASGQRSSAPRSRRCRRRGV